MEPPFKPPPGRVAKVRGSSAWLASTYADVETHKQGALVPCDGEQRQRRQDDSSKQMKRQSGLAQFHV